MVAAWAADIRLGHATSGWKDIDALLKMAWSNLMPRLPVWALHPPVVHTVLGVNVGPVAPFPRAPCGTCDVVRHCARLVKSWSERVVRGGVGGSRPTDISTMVF